MLLLQGLCNAWSDDWAAHLPLVKLLLGNWVNTTMSSSTNDLLYGICLHDPFTALQSVTSLGDLSLPDRHVALRQQALDHLALAQAYMKTWYDRLHMPPPTLHVGDWAWLNFDDGYSILKGLLPPNWRIGVQHIGPYRIKWVVSNLAYKLNLPASSRLHLVISIQHLELYVASGVPIQSHKVTEILRERDTCRHGHQYLVHFDHARHDQWVPVTTITNDTVLQAWRNRQARGIAPPCPTPSPDMTPASNA